MIVSGQINLEPIVSRVARPFGLARVLREDGGRRIRESRAYALMPLKISAFPKCYLEDIANGKMSLFEWIEMAKDARCRRPGTLRPVPDEFRARLPGAGDGDAWARRIRHADDVLFAGFHGARSGQTKARNRKGSRDEFGSRAFWAELAPSSVF